MSTPRMRVFAGPNGSGKSTVKQYLAPGMLGVYLNPDDIEKQISESGILDLSLFEVWAGADELIAYFLQSSFLNQAGLSMAVHSLRTEGSRLFFGDVVPNSYFASVAVDFMRRNLMERGATFTFETVMSSPDKIELMKTARILGYRVYLYYVATDDPSINLSRVQNRVREGGHDVPADKIVSRYHRSLGLLPSAIEHSDRAYIFDNSGYMEDCSWIAEITNGTDMQLHTDYTPSWFENTLLE